MCISELGLQITLLAVGFGLFLLYQIGLQKEAIKCLPFAFTFLIGMMIALM